MKRPLYYLLCSITCAPMVSATLPMAMASSVSNLENIEDSNPF
ncbi:hypothetical protein [Collinsella sp. AF37-9]|nr:hypothetical protein [Collinsella sp. AF37-9]